MARKNSDNTLLTLAIVVAIISIIGFLLVLVPKFTGYQVDTDQATTSVEIASNVVITFTISTVNWGPGFVNVGQLGATLDTNESTIPVEGALAGTWDRLATGDGLTGGFILVNEGNEKVSLELAALNVGSNAANFIGGTNPVFEMKVVEDASEPGTACTTPGIDFGVYKSVLVSPTVSACGVFEWDDGGANSDQLEIHTKIFIPNDALSGTRTATIVATGTKV